MEKHTHTHYHQLLGECHVMYVLSSAIGVREQRTSKKIEGSNNSTEVANLLLLVGDWTGVAVHLAGDWTAVDER